MLRRKVVSFLMLIFELELLALSSRGQKLGRFAKARITDSRARTAEAFDPRLYSFPNKASLGHFKMPQFVPSNIYHVTLFRSSLVEAANQDFVVEIVKAFEFNGHQVKYLLDSVVAVNKGIETRLDTQSNALFSVDEDDGVIKAVSARSSYTADSYVIHVLAQSTWREDIHTLGKVEVQMSNSMDSLFDKLIYETSVEENVEANQPLLQLNPLERNNQMALFYRINPEFSVPSHIATEWFNIDAHTGLISTNSLDIDYEKFAEVLLAIDVFESNNSTSVHYRIPTESIFCKVTIIDLNDNQPTFDTDYWYDVSITEDDLRSIGGERIITRFSAYDLDGTAPNKDIEYSIVSIDANKGVKSKTQLIDGFRLIREEVKHALNNHEVSLVRVPGFNLDRELYGNEIRVTINAKDHGRRPHSLYSTRVIKIQLKDLNDNKPMIVNMNGVESISLRENHQPYRPFFQVKAVDLDEGINSELVYEIQREVTKYSHSNSSRSNVTAIDQSGNIYLTSGLDYETVKQIEIVIRIYDKSSRPLSTAKNLMIHVVNINDNPPKIVNLPTANSSAPGSESCVFRIQEGSKSRGAVVHAFKAFDADNIDGAFEYHIFKVTTLIGPNLVSRYEPRYKELSKTNQVFQLDKENGTLKIKRGFELDHERIDNYQIYIILKDQPDSDGVQLETRLKCQIFVVDVNDNAPKFVAERPLSTISIYPIPNQPNLVGWFQAQDKDAGENGTVAYHLKFINATKGEITERKIFQINSQGLLSMNLSGSKTLKPILKSRYELTIIARDLGRPFQMESRHNLTVLIDSKYFEILRCNRKKNIKNT